MDALFARNGFEFKRQFVTQFLAAYAATHYDDACARGDQEKLQRLPVEDASFLADCAWDRWASIIHPNWRNSNEQH